MLGAAGASAKKPVPGKAPAITSARGIPTDDRPVLGRGLASWYGAQLHRRRTASGERFDMHALTAAHPWLPFGSKVCVRSLVTGKVVVVRINDRGPHTARRIIDLSHAAAKALGLLERGTKQVVLTAWNRATQDCPST